MENEWLSYLDKFSSCRTPNQVESFRIHLWNKEKEKYLPYRLFTLTIVQKYERLLDLVSFKRY